MPALSFYELLLRARGVSLTLRIHPEKMFVPNLVSLLSAAVMRVEPGDIFCDVCSGSGLHAIMAAKLGARQAYGVDVNPVAVEFASLNARLNGVGDRCRFFQGDLVAPLAQKKIKADCLTFTGPQCPSTYADRPIAPELQTAVNGGPDGSAVNVRFVREVKTVLAEGGRFYQPTAAWARPSSSLLALREEGYAFRPVFRTSVPVWGRGNNSRDWFLRHPGSRRLAFDYPEQAAGRTRILEACRPQAGRRFAPLSSESRERFIEVDFNVRRAAAADGRRKEV